MKKKIVKQSQLIFELVNYDWSWRHFFIFLFFLYNTSWKTCNYKIKNFIRSYCSSSSFFFLTNAEPMGAKWPSKIFPSLFFSILHPVRIGNVIQYTSTHAHHFLKRTLFPLNNTIEYFYTIVVISQDLNWKIPFCIFLREIGINQRKHITIFYIFLDKICRIQKALFSLWEKRNFSHFFLHSTKIESYYTFRWNLHLRNFSPFLFMKILIFLAFTSDKHSFRIAIMETVVLSDG